MRTIIGMLLVALLTATASAQSSKQAIRNRYHWYELTEAQNARLRASITEHRNELIRPVLILSATADSLGLAEDIDSALNDAGLSSTIDRPMDVVDGCHSTSPFLAEIVHEATGIPVIVDEDTDPDHYVLNFGRKR